MKGRKGSILSEVKQQPSDFNKYVCTLYNNTVYMVLRKIA